MRIYSVTWGSDDRMLYHADSMQELLERLSLEKVPERYLKISLEGVAR